MANDLQEFMLMKTSEGFEDPKRDQESGLTTPTDLDLAQGFFWQIIFDCNIPLLFITRAYSLSFSLSLLTPPLSHKHPFAPLQTTSNVARLGNNFGNTTTTSSSSSTTIAR